MPAGTFPESLLESLHLEKGRSKVNKGGGKQGERTNQPAVCSTGRANQISRGRLGHDQ